MHARIKMKNTDVKQEKQHNDLIHGVENFVPNSLKRTDTHEKVVLPNAEGKFALLCFDFSRFE